MLRFNNSAVQRHAIWTVHGEKCYQCGTPVDLQSMQVDHVVPQSLARNPDRLAEVLRELGRPESFNVNGFENLLPSCATCNRKKSDTPWQPSLAAQRELQNAQSKAERVEALANQTRARGEIAELLNRFEQHKDNGNLTAEDAEALQKLTQYQFVIRTPDMEGQPVHIVKEITFGTVMSTKDMTFVHMPGFTLKTGPGGGFFSYNVRCKSCGANQFNGTVCLKCGTDN